MLKRTARWSLLTLEVFLAVTATYGAVFVVQGQPKELLRGSPFSDYVIPAVALGVVVGGGAALAAVSLVLQWRYAALLSVVVGASIVIFEIVETTVVGLDVWLHALGLRPEVSLDKYGAGSNAIPSPMGVPLPLWLQPFYILVGLLIIALALRLRLANSIAVKRGQMASNAETSYMPFALLALAASLAATVLLGPLGFGVLVWRVSAIGLNQTYGADGASLLIVVPAAAVAAWLWRRRSHLAAPLALGVGLATLYYALASVMGPDYVRYAGNNERFFPLLLALIVLSWTIAALAWTSLSPAPAQPPGWLAGSLAVVLLLGAAAIGLAWLKQILELSFTGTFSAAADLTAYHDAPSGFWMVRIVDLGFIVPMSLATGFGLWRRKPAAIKAAYGVTAFLVLQATSVLAMGTLMLLRQDPTATPGLVVVLAPISVGLIVLTGVLFGLTQQTHAIRPGRSV